MYEPFWSRRLAAVLLVAGAFSSLSACVGAEQRTASTEEATTSTDEATTSTDEAMTSDEEASAADEDAATSEDEATTSPLLEAGLRTRSFTFINKCKETVWVGALGNPGHTAPTGGGWKMAAGASQSVSIPPAWAGRFWGRRNCSFNSAGAGSCETGDCGNRLQCNGAGGVPPTSLAEFTLDGGGAADIDFYDVSLVDGYDFGIEIAPKPAHTNPNAPYQCGTPTCKRDLLSVCPSELQKRNAAGKVVACLSACAAFNTDQYCCRGAYGTPSSCNPAAWPKNYAAIFKGACPTEYSYAYDDQLSTFTCGNPSPDYTITFCPSGGGGSPPSRLPFVVDSAYAASGYMGDASGIKSSGCSQRSSSGAKGACHQFVYTQPTSGSVGWSGVYWQYPANNWGAQPGYAIPSGATRATFKAKGQHGGERVKFQVGGIGNGSTPHRDTLHASAEVTLTSSWKSYSVSFAGQSYQEVLGGFGWTMTAGGSHGGGFSVDDIRWR